MKVFRAIYSLNQVWLSCNTEAVAVLGTTENKGLRTTVRRYLMGRHGHLCAAAYCWSHDFGRYALLPSNIVSEISTPSIGIPLAPRQF
jgi:hypothetical protein